MTASQTEVVELDTWAWLRKKQDRIFLGRDLQGGGREILVGGGSGRDC